MSTADVEVLAVRLTAARLGSYLTAANDDLARAIDLYDWNTSVSGALYEDLGRLEIVFRNTVDQALTAYGAERGWATPWYTRPSLFPGRQGERALSDIAAARRRSTLRRRPEVHGNVIAELNFGFWRFLCTPPYLTSLWVPALAAGFPNHPSAGDARAVRASIADRMQQLHFLRNRIAHHEPIHHRPLARDVAALLDVGGWMCEQTRRWIEQNSRTTDVLTRRPGTAPVAP